MTRVPVLVMGFKVSPLTALGTAGGWADVLALRKEVSNDLHDRELSLRRNRYSMRYLQTLTIDICASRFLAVQAWL